MRINGLDTKWALDDLKTVLPAIPDGIRLLKADSPEIVERLALSRVLSETNHSHSMVAGGFPEIS